MKYFEFTFVGVMLFILKYEELYPNSLIKTDIQLTYITMLMRSSKVLI